MAVKHKVLFFLEDSAQEAIIPALFLRLIEEEGLSPEDFDLRVLEARGGKSLSSLRQFIKEARKQSHLSADLLVIGSDANCQGFTARRDKIFQITDKSDYHDIIAAIPDPRVERWYLLDPAALAKVADVPLTSASVPYKCEKNRYKILLKRAFEESGISPPLGGIEYGEEMAQQMDLYTSGKLDHGFNDYIEKTRAWLKQVINAS